MTVIVNDVLVDHVENITVACRLIRACLHIMIYIIGQYAMSPRRTANSEVLR